MTIVVDASVMVAALVDDGPTGRWAVDRLAEDVLAAPDLLPVEVTNVLRKAELAGGISAEMAGLAVGTLAQIQVQLWPFSSMADRVWELRLNLSAYDGFYVALAELIDAPLVTLDLRLAGAPGPRCRFLTPS